MKKSIATEIITILFIVLFVYAASSKLVDYQKFRVQLEQSPMLTAFAGSVAWFVPSVEIIIAISLITDQFRLAALYASFSLMVMFSTYIVFIKNFSEYIPCSCGGILQNMNWNQHLVFNISFVSLAAAGIFLYQNKFS